MKTVKFATTCKVFSHTAILKIVTCDLSDKCYGQVTLCAIVVVVCFVLVLHISVVAQALSTLVGP